MNGGFLRRWLKHLLARAKPSHLDDLAPTLARIAAGHRLAFRNDGAIFHEPGKFASPRPPGHYREYVDPTEGMAGPGPRRIIIGQDGELYYTKDHYKSFSKLN
jgi:guanyl-specific ribonuclease Sa